MELSTLYQGYGWEAHTSARCQGRISDGGFFNETYFKKSLKENTMQLPSPHPLPRQSDPAPFVFVADDAFPLTVKIIKLSSRN
ncbi:hypothetical protein J437_LFUL000353 [Ladona fulva]|uniref:DDE Tnp4 domain-containing protein n=1 Tax=Ladona fulva TaxID=123851 RepID=A0A8K0JV20_LADFU|nr:hypothetical protein J437_LFUL000353 [Ladona fulva]